MPNAELKSLFKGQFLGVVPQQHINHYTEAFQALYADRHLTVVARGGEAQIVVYPHLSEEELDKWDALMDRINRELRL